MFRGVVKVKLGAIATAFKGQANFVERDDDSHRAVLKGEGRDTTGKGNASALITATAGVDRRRRRRSASSRPTCTSPARSPSSVEGIMGDVSKKLMNQFATNLNTMLDQQPAAPAAPRPAERRSEADRLPSCTDAATDCRPCVEQRRRATARRPAPSTTGRAQDQRPGRRADRAVRPRRSAILKRALPLFGGLALLWLVVRRLTPPLIDVSDDVAAVRELIGRPPRGAFEVVVRDADGEPGGHAQRAVARRRRADADPLLAGRQARGPRGQPPRGRRRRPARRGRDRPGAGRRRPSPLRRRARRRRSRPTTPAHARTAASAAHGPASSACTPTTPGSSPAATTRWALGSPTSSPDELDGRP